MIKFRASLVVAVALLVCACDHHNKTNQAQAEAGHAAVAGDSSYTGLPSSTNGPVYPRALPVDSSEAAPPVASTSNTPPPALDLPPGFQSGPSQAQPPGTASSANASPDTSSSTTASAAPATDTSSPPPAAAAGSGTAAPAAAPASSTADNGSDLPRLALNSPNPVAASAPSNSQEEQVVVIDTSLGRIVIEPDASAAPKTSENFIKLASDGFYNHTIFHRVIPHFIIQGGDPNSLSEDRSLQGKGGPGYTLPPEIKLKHERGAVAMARLPDAVNPARESNGSQFYICVVNAPSLDDQYTVFGHVIKGMDVVDAISNEPRDSHDNPLNRIEMEVTVEPKEQAVSENSASNQ